MPIKVNIFSSKIREAMHNPDAVYASGDTVGECLDDLIKQYPDLENLIFDKQRKLRREVYVFVNAESLHKVELSRPIKASDTLIIAVMITGG
jgi:molybdopterin converting factor small subunit